MNNSHNQIQGSSTIAIIGAGFAGFTTAIGLLTQGIPTTLYESREQFDQLLSPYQMGFDTLSFHIFSRLSVKLPEPLYYFPTEKELCVRYGTADLRKKNLFLFNIGSRLYRRTDILKSLKDRFEELGGVIKFGYKFKGYSLEKKGVKINFSNQTPVYSSLLIGADGKRSRVKHQLLGDKKGVLEPKGIEYRALVDSTPEFESFVKEHNMPAYSMLVNSVGMLSYQKIGDKVGLLLLKRCRSTNTSINKIDVSRQFHQEVDKVAFHPALKNLFASAVNIDAWQTGNSSANNVKQALPAGPVTLVGDAIAYFGINGANMGVQAAYELAISIGNNDLAGYKYRVIKQYKIYSKTRGITHLQSPLMSRLLNMAYGTYGYKKLERFISRKLESAHRLKIAQMEQDLAQPSQCIILKPATG